MKVDLAYGRTGLEIDLPDNTHVIRSYFVPGLKEEFAALSAALRSPIQAPPLREWAGPGSKVVIAHTDITRATPLQRIIPVVLAELKAAGVRVKISPC